MLRKYCGTKSPEIHALVARSATIGSDVAVLTDQMSPLLERGALLFLRYAGRWGTLAVKNKLNLSSLVPGRHGEKYVCPCQYIEEHLKVKPPAGIAKYFTLPHQNVQIY